MKLVKKIYFAPQYRKYLKELEHIEEHFRSQQGKYYKQFSAVKSKQYDKEWFASGIEVPFEDTTIIVPVGYDNILTTDYGDYMTPPKEHARQGHHTAYYMNLEESLTIDEILKKKAKELVPKQRMGFRVLLDELIHRKGF